MYKHGQGEATIPNLVHLKQVNGRDHAGSHPAELAKYLLQAGRILAKYEDEANSRPFNIERS